MVRFSTALDMSRNGKRGPLLLHRTAMGTRDVRFVARIHPLNLASAVLGFTSPAFGRIGRHVADSRARLFVVKALASLDPLRAAALTTTRSSARMALT